MDNEVKEEFRSALRDLESQKAAESAGQEQRRKDRAERIERANKLYSDMVHSNVRPVFREVEQLLSEVNRPCKVVTSTRMQPPVTEINAIVIHDRRLPPMGGLTDTQLLDQYPHWALLNEGMTGQVNKRVLLPGVNERPSTEKITEAAALSQDEITRQILEIVKALKEG